MTGSAALAAEQRKHNANDVKCSELGWKCVPLAVESYGCWGTEAQHLTRLASCLATRYNTSKDFPSYLQFVQETQLNPGEGKCSSSAVPSNVLSRHLLDSVLHYLRCVCRDTLAPSHLSTAERGPGLVAAEAESQKKKYSSLGAKYFFVHIACESLGVFGAETLSFLKDLGHRHWRLTILPVLTPAPFCGNPERKFHLRLGNIKFL